MVHIKRLNEMEYVSAVKPMTYIMHSGSNDIDLVWEVAVYIRNEDELQGLVDLESVSDFTKTEYSSGKCELEVFGKTLSFQTFKKKLADENRGMRTLHSYTMKNKIGEIYNYHIYVPHSLDDEMIQLSDERLVHRLKYTYDPQLWDKLCKRPHAELEKKYGTYFYLLGRGMKRVCVENTLENRIRFPEMLADVKRAQDKIVDKYNSEY